MIIDLAQINAFQLLKSLRTKCIHERIRFLFLFQVTKCIFHKYGPSGSIQKHDALCVMALNIVNEKIYTVLWFWFVVLAVITGLGLVWRMLTMILHARLLNFVLAYFSVVSVAYKFMPRSLISPLRILNIYIDGFTSRIKNSLEKN